MKQTDMEITLCINFFHIIGSFCNTKNSNIQNIFLQFTRFLKYFIIYTPKQIPLLKIYFLDDSSHEKMCLLEYP